MGNSSGTPSKTGPKGGLVRLASAEQSTVEQGINNLAVSQPAGGDATTPKSALSGGYLNCYKLANNERLLPAAFTVRFMDVSSELCASLNAWVVALN